MINCSWFSLAKRSLTTYFDGRAIYRQNPRVIGLEISQRLACWGGRTEGRTDGRSRDDQNFLTFIGYHFSHLWCSAETASSKGLFT